MDRGDWVEPDVECEFCHEMGRWPTIFKAGPYWTHEPCLIKAVEEGRRS